MTACAETMRAGVARERREYVHSPLLGGVELLAAEYRQHIFPRHVQEQVVLGIVERGRIRFVGGGIDMEMGEGDILFVAPGTVHEAVGHGDGAWTYRALYLTPDQWAASCTTLGASIPDGASVFRNASLTARLRRAHRHLVNGTLPERALEDVLRRLVDAVVTERSRVVHCPGGSEAGDALARVRQLLDTRYSRRMSLAEMASVSGLSRFHFLRAFSRAYGVSPCAYSVNRRLLEAQRRLSAGEPISMTALEVGFADQAHLTRHFLRTIGVTPGEYQRAFA